MYRFTLHPDFPDDLNVSQLVVPVAGGYNYDFRIPNSLTGNVVDHWQCAICFQENAILGKDRIKREATRRAILDMSLWIRKLEDKVDKILDMMGKLYYAPGIPGYVDFREQAGRQ